MADSTPEIIRRLDKNTSKQLTMHPSCVTETIGLHWHAFFELEFIISGEGLHVLNDTPYEMKRGEIHLIRPTDIHELRVTHDIELYLIQFPESQLTQETFSRLLGISGDIIVYLDECDSLAVEGICVALEQLRISDMSGNIEIIDGLVNSVLMILLNRLSAKGRSAKLITKYDSRIRRAILMLQLHYRDRINMADIAWELEMNPDYFSACFKRDVGITPREYLAMIRLEYARKLTVMTDMKIIDICMESGYNSITTFLRDFKQKYGCTPSEFRGLRR